MAKKWLAVVIVAIVRLLSATAVLLSRSKAKAVATLPTSLIPSSTPVSEPISAPLSLPDSTSFVFDNLPVAEQVCNLLQDNRNVWSEQISVVTKDKVKLNLPKEKLDSQLIERLINLIKLNHSSYKNIVDTYDLDQLKIGDGWVAGYLKEVSTTERRNEIIRSKTTGCRLIQNL